MPITPRSGAQMTPISLVSPGFMGLNKQSEASILPPVWATEAINCVFDRSGRLAARKGLTMVTGTAISSDPTIVQLAEIRRLTGDVETVFSTSNNKLYRTPSTPVDITGTATVTVGNDWQFVNYNGNLYGFQVGEQPIVYDGTTSFADLTASSGTAPTGNCGIAFAGRLWGATSDGQTLKYSALLDATKWDVADGAGVFDFTSVWPNGADEIMALAIFNGMLVVFGKSSILFLMDIAGSALGIDPDQTIVVDTINSVGCIARDSVQEIEGADLLFLSYAGVQSLRKLVQEKSNPIDNVSKNVRDYLNEASIVNSKIKIKSCYSPENNFYLLSFPTAMKSFCFDTSGRLQDGSFRITEWTLAPAAIVRTSAGTVYMAVDTVAGKVGTYSGYLDNSTTYDFSYSSPWLDLGEELAQYVKIIKNITATVFTGVATPVGLKWDVDFSGTFRSKTGTTEASGGSSEYGVAEYNIGEYSGGSTVLSKININASGTGQFYRVGIQTTVNNSPFAVQQINLFTKIGRLAK